MKQTTSKSKAKKGRKGGKINEIKSKNARKKTARKANTHTCRLASSAGGVYHLNKRTESATKESREAKRKSEGDTRTRKKRKNDTTKRQNENEGGNEEQQKGYIPTALSSEVGGIQVSLYMYQVLLLAVPPDPECKYLVCWDFCCTTRVPWWIGYSRILTLYSLAAVRVLDLE